MLWTEYPPVEYSPTILILNGYIIIREFRCTCPGRTPRRVSGRIQAWLMWACVPLAIAPRGLWPVGVFKAYSTSYEKPGPVPFSAAAHPWISSSSHSPFPSCSYTAYTLFLLEIRGIASELSQPAMPSRAPIRKPHKKSRLGCQECKRRHVKVRTSIGSNFTHALSVDAS